MEVFGLGDLDEEVAEEAYKLAQAGQYVVDTDGNRDRDGAQVWRLSVGDDANVPAGHYLVTEFDPRMIQRVEVDYHENAAVIDHIFHGVRSARLALAEDALEDVPTALPDPGKPGAPLGKGDPLWHTVQTVAYRAIRFRHHTVKPLTVAEMEVHLRPLLNHAFLLLREIARHPNKNDWLEIGDLGPDEDFLASWQ